LELKRKGFFVEDLSEKEQLDAMRTWWSENGRYVIGGIVVGVIIIFGVNQRRISIATAEIAASTLYEEVMFAAASEDLDTAEEAAAGLFSDYDDSPYAALARLAMARIYMDNARDQDAADVLTALIGSDSDNELALIGRHRLAKIMLYQGKAEEVVGLLADQPESGVSARMNEVLGDAYFELQRYSEAQAAYVAALIDNPQAPTVDASLVQLKLNDLPEITAAGSEPEASESVESEAETEAEAEADDNATEDPPAEDAATETVVEGDSGSE
jgi:predicted negative regulator of RcsB-dependent stress response